MKKLISAVTAVLLVSVMLVCPVSAGAEVPNIIISGAPMEPAAGEIHQGSMMHAWFSVNGYPSWDDIIAIGNQTTVTGPAAKNYLSDYRVCYINAAHKNAIYVYNTAERMTQNPKRIEHGARVYVLAEKGTSSLIIYRTRDQVASSGWVSTSLLSDTFPGETEQVGTPYYGTCNVTSDPALTWAGENMAGTDCEYLILDEPVENCVCFTLEYRANGKKDCSGSRDVYVNNGEGWLYVGRFPYSEAKTSQIAVHLEEPISVYAVATPMTVENNAEFTVRENILDVQVATDVP